MNARTVRRSIERKAQKQARKEAARTMTTLPGHDSLEPLENTAEFARPVSVAQLEANRRNACTLLNEAGAVQKLSLHAAGRQECLRNAVNRSPLGGPAP